jgi:hypothetical protein
MKSSNVSINTKTSIQLTEKGKEQNVHVEAHKRRAKQCFMVCCAAKRKSLVLVAAISARLLYVYATQDALFPAGNALKDSRRQDAYSGVCAA